MYYIYGVCENPNVKDFDEPKHLTDQKHVNDLPWTHTIVEQFTLCMIFLMYAASMYWNYSGQKSTKHILQFMFLTHLVPWNKVKVIKPRMTKVDSEQGYNHANFKNLDLLGSEKKPTLKVFVCLFVCLFFQMRTFVYYLLRMHTKVKKVVYSWSS